MKLESPVIDLEPHEWRRIIKWFYKPGWPPWDWRPFLFLYVLVPGLVISFGADFLNYLRS